MANHGSEREAQSLLDLSNIRHTNVNVFSSRISMVPGVLRDLSPGSFSPRVLCIGPLHRDDACLQAFETNKRQHLIDLMRRNSQLPEEEILVSCLNKAHSLMHKIKDSYVWPKDYIDVEIAKMMVTDACFIVEFIFRLSDSCSIDPSKGTMLLEQTLIHYMVLVENQIPFFVLEEIFRLTLLKVYPETSLIQLIRPVLPYVNLFEKDLQIPITSRNPGHILGLIYECYRPEYSIVPTLSRKRTHSAADLVGAGVKFERYFDPRWRLGMEESHRV